MRRLTLSPAVLALALWGASPLLAGPPQHIALGPQRWARFDDKGEWHVESRGGPILVHCGLRVWTKTAYGRQADARVAEPPGSGPYGRAFHGALRVGPRTIRYWQTATPVPNGLLVQYAVAAPGLAQTDRVAIGFDLPVETFRGAACTASQAKAVALPAEKAAKARLVEVDAAALTIRRDGLVVSLQRRRAAKTIVQDGRHWHRPYFQALLFADRAIGDPEGWLSATCLLTLGGPPARPVIAAIVQGKGELACYEVHEAELHFWAPYANPYRPAEVRAWAEVRPPSGHPFRARAFFTRHYQRSLEGDTERLTPVGHARWSLRITPTEPGKHTYTVHVAARNGEATAPALSFTAAPAPPTKGFLHPPTRQTRYLEHANGRPCFLIGHNYCWPPAKQRTYAADAALDAMGNAGINATRLWLSSWGVGIEGSRPDDFRLDDAWRLDHILQRARQRGVYVQVCVDNFTDLTAKERAATNPYLARNGGPCGQPGEFFTSPRAREQYHRRLDYLMARYAPLPSLLAWELCSELDYAAADRRDPALLAWARQAAAYVKKHDPYRHVVTVSLGLGSTWEELWRSPGLDMVQAHAYIHRPIWVTKPHELDEAALVVHEQGRVGSLRKPFLIGEFGFLGTRQVNPLNEADRTGVHLHNAIWAAALSGQAGTPMAWWWDSYIAKNKLRYHHAALARFLRDEDLGRAAWSPIRDQGGGPIRILGLKSDTEALLWVQHRANRWYRRLVERREPVCLKPLLIDLPGLIPGRYRVEWWDTYAGQPITHGLVVPRHGVLSIRVPAGHPDVACKVRRVSD